ncbi:MAG: hypothetical protein COB65_08015 [Thalassobium sp.]|nr:MAG: hypothetical protein COB65_08015 [Thalassobium sp.]
MKKVMDMLDTPVSEKSAVSIARMDQKNLKNEFDYGYNAGAGLVNKLEGFGTFPDMNMDANTTIGKVNEIGKINDTVDISNEDLKVMRDLAEMTHWVSVVKITPDAADDPTIGPDERTRGLAMAEKLPMRIMTRMWQMLLKALEEVAMAPNAMMAAEMAVIRLTHVADLPTPDDLVRKLQDTTPPPSGGGGRPAPSAGQSTEARSPTPAPTHSGPSGPSAHSAQTAVAIATDDSLARFATFESVVALIRRHRDAKLLVDVESGVKLVSYAPGRIEFEQAPDAAPDLAQRLGARLQAFTGNRWAVSVTGSGGAPTIAELRDKADVDLREKAEKHPLVQAVLMQFPTAQITEIRSPKELETEAAEDALPEVDEEWDPFEDS